MPHQLSLVKAIHAPSQLQLSLADINRCLYLLGQLPKQRFFIIGNNIAHSLSPTIHNTAFAELGLPHQYSIYETFSVDDRVKNLIREPDFGGASVTYPHKLAIGPFLDELSEAARLIGAVNTVVVTAGGTPDLGEAVLSNTKKILRGENTDWLGIMSVIRKKSKDMNIGSATSTMNQEPAPQFSTSSGLIIGAGGAARAAAFALQHLGVRNVTIVNRTTTTAQNLASFFPSLAIVVHSQLEHASASDIIIGCVPADDITEGDIPDHIFRSGRGIVVEMSYRPPVSALMKTAKRQKGWCVADGVDVLKEQAYAQFEMWTGRRAPVTIIEEALSAGGKRQETKG